MIEKNPVAGVHIVCLAIVDSDPIGIEFRHSIWRAGIEGCLFGLGALHYFSVEFRGGGLVEANMFVETTCANGIQETKGA